MIETKLKIELAIRSSAIAATLLEMLETNGKRHAKLVVSDAATQLIELDKRVDALPGD